LTQAEQLGVPFSNSSATNERELKHLPFLLEIGASNGCLPDAERQCDIDQI
jgi:hypothetical protein